MVFAGRMDVTWLLVSLARVTKPLRWRCGRPHLHTIDTTNDHMIRVNELLGYRLVATSSEWQRQL
jgi:hypothetical protein